MAPCLSATAQRSPGDECEKCERKRRQTTATHRIHCARDTRSDELRHRTERARTRRANNCITSHSGDNLTGHLQHRRVVSRLIAEKLHIYRASLRVAVRSGGIARAADNLKLSREIWIELDLVQLNLRSVRGIGGRCDRINLARRERQRRVGNTRSEKGANRSRVRLEHEKTNTDGSRFRYKFHEFPRIGAISHHAGSTRVAI
jgi:hypothetical protein